MCFAKTEVWLPILQNRHSRLLCITLGVMLCTKVLLDSVMMSVCTAVHSITPRVMWCTMVSDLAHRSDIWASVSQNWHSRLLCITLGVMPCTNVLLDSFQMSVWDVHTITLGVMLSTQCCCTQFRHPCTLCAHHHSQSDALHSMVCDLLHTDVHTVCTPSLWEWLVLVHTGTG